MLRRKIFGIESWRYALGLAGVVAITLATTLGHQCKEKYLGTMPKEVLSVPIKKEIEVLQEDLSSRIVFYDILPSFDNSVSVSELGRVIKRYRDHMAVRNNLEGSRREDVFVEERDVNRDGKWDLATYLSESGKGRWPVLGLNPKSSEYQPLLSKLGTHITSSTQAKAVYGR